MAKNTNLNNAKKAKNDEFYTRLEDIKKELNNYDPAVFKDKVILCNCDDPHKSNFWIFFHMNFNRLGLNFAKALTINGEIKPNPQRFYINGKRKYSRILIKNKHPEYYQND